MTHDNSHTARPRACAALAAAFERSVLGAHLVLTVPAVYGLDHTAGEVPSEEAFSEVAQTLTLVSDQRPQRVLAMAAL